MENEAYNLYYCKHTKRHLITGMGSSCHPYKILCDECKHLIIDRTYHNQMSCEFGERPEAKVIREWRQKDLEYLKSIGLKPGIYQRSEKIKEVKN